MTLAIFACGFAGHGKDTICDVIEAILKEKKEAYTRESFAGRFKVLVSSLVKFQDSNDTYDQKNKKVHLHMSFESIFASEEIFYQVGLGGACSYDKFISLLKTQFGFMKTKTGYTSKPIAPRKLYQFIGDDIGRNMINDEHWAQIIPITEPIIMFSDLRRHSELENIRNRVSKTIVFRAHSDVRPLPEMHDSEKEVLSLPYDELIKNNGSLKEFQDKVRELFERYYAISGT
ncbi:hypothetical protein [Vibrio alginolyticus]|uniref:deoxynucleotide monophosphate kinase family protein n=1 Tax=Vibrio alginolyticus TaxID=663 RepID=UPI0006CA77BB|nr:hypothetical protein [Vibrio alginolyticus]KPM95046.1 hypothetical protein AOG25_26500 [Vibrio alginolyticus]